MTHGHYCQTWVPVDTISSQPFVLFFSSLFLFDGWEGHMGYVGAQNRFPFVILGGSVDKTFGNI